MAEFGKARYNVDVLKVEVPVEMAFVEGTQSFKGSQAYSRAEALQHFRDAETMTTSPSSTSPPASPTRSSSKHSSWPANPASSSTESSAAAPPGRTAYPSTQNKAPRPSKTGSTPPA